MTYVDVDSLALAAAADKAIGTGPGNSFDSRSLPVGSWNGLKKETIVECSLTAASKTYVGWWHAPFDCRIVAIVGHASQATAAGNKELVLLSKLYRAGSAVAELISDGSGTGITVDDSPTIAADTAKVIVSGTAAADTLVLNSATIDLVKKDDSVRLAVTTGSDGTMAEKAFKFEIIYEPPLADTSKTTQATREYRYVERTKDS